MFPCTLAASLIYCDSPISLFQPYWSQCSTLPHYMIPVMCGMGGPGYGSSWLCMGRTLLVFPLGVQFSAVIPTRLDTRKECAGNCFQYHRQEKHELLTGRCRHVVVAAFECSLFRLLMFNVLPTILTATPCIWVVFLLLPAIFSGADPSPLEKLSLFGSVSNHHYLKIGLRRSKI